MHETWSISGFFLVLSCGLAGLTTGANSADGVSRVFALPGEPAREVRRLPRLRANVSNIERYVVGGVCEVQGVEEVSQVMKGADFEEMWVFLPRAHGTHDCEWHEIGRDETGGRDNAYLRVDMAYLEALMAENTEIHLVHFHPLKYFECAAQANCPRGAAAGRTGSPDPRWITDLVFSMPSPSDVHFMMDVTSRFHARHGGRGTIRHKVVTPYGVVDYGLTDAGLAKFDEEKLGRSEGLYISWVVASRLEDDSVERVIDADPESLDAAVSRLAQTLNTEFLRVSHRTLKRSASN